MEDRNADWREQGREYLVLVVAAVVAGRLADLLKSARGVHPRGEEIEEIELIGPGLHVAAMAREHLVVAVTGMVKMDEIAGKLALAVNVMGEVTGVMVVMTRMGEMVVEKAADVACETKSIEMAETEEQVVVNHAMSLGSVHWNDAEELRGLARDRWTECQGRMRPSMQQEELMRTLSDQ